MLRASAALIVLSAIWWFVLLDPLLFAFRQAGGLLGSIVVGQAGCELITETPARDWQVCLPAAQSGLNTVTFELARSGPTAFTFGLPVFWAVLLAVPRKGRWWRNLLLGTAAATATECVLLLLFLKTYAHAVLAQPGIAQHPVTKWFLDSAQYLELSVLPAFAPFVIATWLLWDQIRRMLQPATPADEDSQSRRVSR